MEYIVYGKSSLSPGRHTIAHCGTSVEAEERAAHVRTIKGWARVWVEAEHGGYAGLTRRKIAERLRFYRPMRLRMGPDGIRRGDGTVTSLIAALRNEGRRIPRR